MSKVLITPEAMLSFPNLFTPRAVNEGDEPKYSATFVFGADSDISELQDAVLAVGKETWGADFAGMVKKGTVRLPFRTDGEEKGYPEDSTFITARNRRAPGVVSVYPDPNNPDRPAKIEDEAEVYPGAIVKGLVSVFAYHKPNKGITFGLEGLQKIRDGERLDGRASAQSMFSVDPDAFKQMSIPEEEEAPADDGDEDLLALLGGS